MGWISHIREFGLLRAIRRVGGGLLVLVASAVMLWQVPHVAHQQDESTYWKQYAQAYLAHKNQPEPKLIADLQQLDDIKGLETFTRVHLDNALSQMKQFDCLTTAIYYEARSEPAAGRIAVGKVVLNRVKSRVYPNSICKVVFEGASRKTGCQFTFTCDGSMQEAPRDAGWERSREAALNAWLGLSDVTIGRATHYHTVAVDPVWAHTLMRTANVGNHVFYRFPSRREKRLLGSEI